MKRNKPKFRAAHYQKIVEWSGEDGCFVGSAPPLIGECCHGHNEGKVYAELCEIVDEWIDIFETEGKPLPAPLDKKEFSGKFVLRVQPALDRRLAAKAIAAGESLNGFCVKALVKA